MTLIQCCKEVTNRVGIWICWSYSPGVSSSLYTAGMDAIGRDLFARRRVESMSGEGINEAVADAE
jgi:hypothetical protein